MDSDAQARTRDYRDSLSVLYPSDVWDLPVIDGLPAPTYPKPSRFKPHDSPRFVDRYGKDLALGALQAPHSDDRLVLVNKPHPHSLYDLMLIVANDDIRNGPTDIDIRTLRQIIGTGAMFAEYVGDWFGRSSSEDGRPYITIGYNHDRDTLDRDNAQWFDKRLHWHFIAWPQQYVELLRPKRFRQISSSRARRRLIDPIGFLAAEILYAALRGTKLHGSVERPNLERDRILGLPVGFKVAVPDGWKFLKTPECAEMVALLHEQAGAAFAEIKAAITNVADCVGPWERPALVNAREAGRRLLQIEWLTPELRDRILLLHGRLRNVTPAEMASYRANPELADSKLAIPYLDYHLGFCAPAPESIEGRQGKRGVHLFMQFKLLSSPGPVVAVGGANAVILERRSRRIMSWNEIEQRSAFQRGFAAYVGAAQEIDWW